MNKSKLNILFVAFEFPPLGGGGVQRSMKFVKYLPEFGYNPIVVTVAAEDYPHVMPRHKVDPSLLQELPESTVIERVHCGNMPPTSNKLIQWARIFFSVSEDFKTTWKPYLEQALPEIIKKYQPVAVYVTLPPFAMGTLWRKLMASYDIPLIFDFRDAWSQWCVQVNGTYLHYWAKKKAERKALEAATAVICTSTQIKADFLRVHPAIPENKVNVITNGFDDEIPVLPATNWSKKDKWVIGYVGNFYYTPESRAAIFKPWWKRKPHRMLNYVPRKEDWLYRSPYFFLKAIRQLLDDCPAFNNKISIHFAGITPNWLLEQINSFGLEHICTHAGYLNHQQVIDFQKKCDALLITSSKVIGGKDYSIAGKTFEYFTIGKPILAFVCEGVQKELLKNSGQSVIFDPDETSTSAVLLKEWLEGKIQLQPDHDFIMKHHRKTLTADLAGVINQAIGRNK